MYQQYNNANHSALCLQLLRKIDMVAFIILPTCHGAIETLTAVTTPSITLAEMSFKTHFLHTIICQSQIPLDWGSKVRLHAFPLSLQLWRCYLRWLWGLAFAREGRMWSFDGACWWPAPPLHAPLHEVSGCALAHGGWHFFAIFPCKNFIAWRKQYLDRR